MSRLNPVRLSAIIAVFCCYILLGLRASIGRGAAVRRGSNYADDGAVTRIGEIRERNARADLLARGGIDLCSAGFAANGLQQPVQQRRRLRSREPRRFALQSGPFS